MAEIFLTALPVILFVAALLLALKTFRYNALIAVLGIIGALVFADMCFTDPMFGLLKAGTYEQHYKAGVFFLFALCVALFIWSQPSRRNAADPLNIRSKMK